MMAAPHFSLSSTVRRYPRLPYEKMKNDILGVSYSLSLAFVGEARARAINRTNRKKTYAPNVLSFPLEHGRGEIIITPSVARREAKARGMTERGYVGFLFIHGLLHLKGMVHGDTMERAEKRYTTRYDLA